MPGDGLADAGQALLVVRDRVLAPHPVEDVVVAGLDRQVERGADRGRLGHRVDEPVREVPRVRRDEAEARHGRAAARGAQGIDRADQLGEVRPRGAVDLPPGPARLGDVGEARLRGQVMTVAVDVLAEERDLAVAGRGERPRLVHHLVERPAPLGPAAERDDAVGAGLVAAVDDREPRRDRRFAAHRPGGDGVGARAREVVGGRDRERP